MEFNQGFNCFIVDAMSDGASDEPPICFSVQRLSKSSLVDDFPVKFSLEEDIRDGVCLALSEEERAQLVGEEGFSGRVHASKAASLCGLQGYLRLQKGFAQTHLGESILCYVSASNNCGYTLNQVEIVVEIATNRARALLFENRDTLMPELKADGRKDFLIRYDVKDVGEHQIRCMASFTNPKKERIMPSPQTTRFVAMAPLSIRTKLRPMGESCVLEACLECLKTEGPLVLDYVRFEPVKRYVVTPIEAHQDECQEGPLKDYINDRSGKIMGGHHCTRNFLFRLDPNRTDLTQGDLEVKTLGKLEIKWHVGFGDFGRLQTQQIQGQKSDETDPTEILGRILALGSSEIVAYHPFEVLARICNYTDDTIGPITIALLDAEGSKDDVVRMFGSDKVRLGELPGGENRDTRFSLVCFRSGIQSIGNLKLIDETTGGIVGSIEKLDVFVNPLCG